MIRLKRNLISYSLISHLQNLKIIVTKQLAQSHIALSSARTRLQVSVLNWSSFPYLGCLTPAHDINVCQTCQDSFSHYLHHHDIGLKQWKMATQQNIFALQFFTLKQNKTCHKQAVVSTKQYIWPTQHLAVLSSRTTKKETISLRSFFSKAHQRRRLQDLFPANTKAIPKSINVFCDNDQWILTLWHSMSFLSSSHLLGKSENITKPTCYISHVYKF